MRDLPEVVEQQAGIVSRRQLLDDGWAEHDIRRAVRRRDLTRCRPGVYATHSGPLTWAERATTAVLAARLRPPLPDGRPCAWRSARCSA